MAIHTQMLMRLELKILHRYVKPGWLTAFVWMFFLLFHLLFSPEQTALQINESLLMAVLVVSITAMYSQDFFWAGQNSPMFRYFYLTDFRKMLMVKNLFLIAMTVVILIPIYVASLLFFGLPLSQVSNAFIFYWMAIFTILSLGNIFSIRNRSRRSTATGFSMLIQTGVVFICSVVPYMVVIGLFQSYLASGIFIVLTGMLWYWVSLPATERQLLLNKYQILEEI